MKISKILLTCFVVISSLQSCKNEKNNDETKDSQELQESFEVKFNLITNKDDVFTLYYTEDGSLKFGDFSVKAVVKGNDKPQDLLFKLPANALPTNIRLDFGDNKDQGNVVLKSMKLKYINNIYEKTFGPNDEISHYFYPLEAQVKINDATNTIELLKPSGQVHDPLIWSNQLLSDEMVKLYKNNK